MPLIHLSKSDGSYDRMKNGWREQCEAADEEFEFWAQGTFDVMDQLVADPLAVSPSRQSGVYAAQQGDDLPGAICMANWVRSLAGYAEPVLRVRLITMSPAIDLGQFAPAEAKNLYVSNLTELFSGILELSQGVMAANEIKFHLGSPEDYNFFKVVTPELSRFSGFSRVEMKGTWLYITVAP
jgi:hypothetical protein